MITKTYVGIDNGISGAIAALSPEDRFIILEPVKTVTLGRRLLLDNTLELEERLNDLRFEIASEYGFDCFNLPGHVV